MKRPNLTVEKLNGALGRRAATNDMITAAVMNAVASDDLVLNKVYDFLNIGDVEALGLNAEYDQTNKVLVYSRLKRLFDRNPSITVHCMFVAQNVTMTQMCDKANNYLALILRSKKGTVVQAFVCRNPDEEYEPTIETGIDADSINAMYKAQELCNFEFEKDRYCDFFIEGRSFSGLAATALHLREPVNECPDVSLILFADNDVSKSDALYAGYAAVEDFVGLLSIAEVSQNAGELIPQFNLTDAANGYFLNAGLSSGKHIDEISEESLDLLNEKGYILCGYTSGIPGIYITDTNTCSDIESDYAYVENNRTIKKAIKLARTALLPRIKARIYVDPINGKIAPEVAKDIEILAKTAIKPMEASGDISGGIAAYVDPEQNVLATSKLFVSLTFVPVAIGRYITLKIGFNNPLNS
ncbi:DUF2586 family protein [Flavobacterium cerinum]|uniref:DUF2586 family protein n=1 Tax=Flavobacterium cerinum TaxID=2502784 RepID=A0A444HEM2_9FLAO|nr:DUF2586 family protein [Flavobacterium cerinum]RWX03364.1 hypothetical protein EPI11_00095 [Flavobacterium cerinum]